MADEVYGLGSEDIQRLRKLLAWYESAMQKPSMRRRSMPATAEGINYITGTLTGALALDGTADITLDTPLDDGTTELEVYGLWFAAESGEVVGATWNPFEERYDADRVRCPE